jgi:arylsulfatase A-like enzyme
MNVIVIINDSLRWDYLGCYGNNWIKTPNIDKLASESAVFDYFYPEGLPTVPCRTTFFTGRFTFPFRGWQRLEPTDLLLAEILWNKGFTSAMITDVYHLHKPSMAFERGLIIPSMSGAMRRTLGFWMNP